jgi:hypothetical protein
VILAVLGSSELLGKMNLWELLDEDTPLSQGMAAEEAKDEQVY